MNYNIKLDLTKLKNVSIVNSSKRGLVVVIPVEENEIFVSEKTGSAYINMKATYRPNDWQSHSIKQRLHGGYAAFCGTLSEVGSNKPVNADKQDSPNVKFDDFKGLPF
jgi:hypothetical protein